MTQIKTCPLSKKVLMITVVHPPLDPRIYHKEILTLVENGFEVTLIAPLESDALTNGVKTIGLPFYKNRPKRILNCIRATYFALRSRFDYYHFHDPEFLIWGFLIKLLTFKPVFYDIHEDYPDMMMHKEYINPWLRRFLKLSVRTYENLFAPAMDHLILADNSIDHRFKHRHPHRTVLFNYPKMNYFDKLNNSKKTNRIIYVGGVSEVRGSEVMLNALALVRKTIPDVELRLVGKIVEREYETRIRKSIDVNKLHENVRIDGVVSHLEAIGLIQDSSIGLSILQDIPKFNKNIPTKIFEYMACGIPVIASDLEPIREYVIHGECGLLVRPNDLAGLANAIVFLLENPQARHKMGQKGRELIRSKYNWESMEERLLQVYSNA